jgi:hypothetical protein
MQRINKSPIRIDFFLLMALGFFCLALWAGNAQAAEGTGPCAGDIAKFCKDAKPGGGAQTKCLKEHENELSPACKTFVTEGRKKAKEGREACKADVEKFCKDVKPGGGKIMKCLKDNESKLSSECQKTLPKSKK